MSAKSLAEYGRPIAKTILEDKGIVFNDKDHAIYIRARNFKKDALSFNYYDRMSFEDKKRVFVLSIPMTPDENAEFFEIENKRKCQVIDNYGENKIRMYFYHTSGLTNIYSITNEEVRDKLRSHSPSRFVR